MKGLACLFVLLGHFTGIYKYTEKATAIDSWFTQMLTKGPLSFFTAESFLAVLVFCPKRIFIVYIYLPGNAESF